ncbi:MAG: ABC transporter ATP-binding protein [Methanobacterium sp.]|uniref:metal ABC transporter ATP-binding protein n=1 Tax=Methanobacterium sp. TaxID=2164 RepID=UPI003D6513C7|nr:ABC transporter ATP-binding protein [Methanobacterium sp.]
MTAEALNLNGVYVNLNNIPILEDINLSVNENDFIAIIGPNGGGKTTLLKAVLGLTKLYKGNIKVFGKNPSDGRKFIGYLPQHPFFDHSFPINVYDVALMGRYRGLFKNYENRDKKAVDNALNAVEMFEFKDRQISELSGGQLQRVFIARAIAREPKLLLLDEPTASVDPEMQRSFYDLLSSLKDKMTIILITHDVGVVSSYVDKIACLNMKLFYHGHPEDSASGIEAAYHCPIELIGHGVPHRVFKKH